MCPSMIYYGAAFILYLNCSMFLPPVLGRSRPNSRQKGARYALFILTMINLLNFADRYVPSAVKTLIKDELHLSDTETALPTFGMVLVYSVFAVIFGWCSDYELVDRRVILAVAIFFWSCATALAGLADNLSSLVCLRSLVGVGEAAYGVIAPPMLSDFYMLHERQVVYAVYYLALPVGAALGFIIGALLGSAYSWRVAFFVCGIPGILVAFSALRIQDPARGINDSEYTVKLLQKGSSKIAQRISGEEDVLSPQHSHRGNDHVIPDLEQDNEDDVDGEANDKEESNYKDNAQQYHQHNHHHTVHISSGVKPQLNIEGLSTKEVILHTLQEFKEILTNPLFMFTTMGLAANGFALGGLADWYATYLLRYNGASLESAGLIAGAATIIGGIFGNVLGCKVADHFDGKIRSSYLTVPALFCLPATLCNIWAVNAVNNSASAYAAIFLTQIFAWTQIGPICAVSISCVPPHLRARSSGILIIIQHFLGDVISPPIIGALSDSTGSLQIALQCTWIALLVSALWWGAAGMFLAPVSYATEKSVEKEKELVITYYDILCTKDHHDATED